MDVALLLTNCIVDQFSKYQKHHELFRHTFFQTLDYSAQSYGLCYVHLMCQWSKTILRWHCYKHRYWRQRIALWTASTSYHIWSLVDLCLLTACFIQVIYCLSKSCSILIRDESLWRAKWFKMLEWFRLSLRCRWGRLNL